MQRALDATILCGAVIFVFDEFELDSERLELRRNGKLVKADLVPLRLLLVLVRNAGQLVTKEELVAEVWGGRAVADNVISVSIARLRQTLRDRRGARGYLVAVYGRGYRFAPLVTTRRWSSAPAAASEAGSAGHAPFVGREAVLSRLRRAVAEACAGTGGICVLIGEPGIGKTYTVERLERELSASSLRVAWGYCHEAGDTPPLAPWLRLVRETLAGMPDVRSEFGAIGDAVSSWPRRPKSGGALENPRRSTPASAARHHGFEALLRTCKLAADRVPLVLVFDDLHRADAASLELLSMLADEIARTRILVVATLRDTASTRAQRAESYLPLVLGHRNCQRVELERLGAEEVAAYVSGVVDDQDGRLGHAVFIKSEGNPFFMSELARQLQDSERPEPAQLVVPSSALELIRQHLDELHATTREVLSVAAVIGHSFELPLLSVVLGRQPGLLMASIDDALASDVLVAAPDSITAFAFGHELLRTVLYDAQPPCERRSRHLSIGSALDKRSKDGEAIPPSDIAYHLYAALPQGDLRRTVDACRAAAAASAEALAPNDAIRYARHALEALDLVEPSSPRLRLSLLFTIALHARAHASDEFLRSIKELVHLAREQRDGPMLARAARLLNVNAGLQPMPEAAAVLEQALALLEPAQQDARAAALAALAYSAPACCSRERSDSLLAEAEALAQRSGDVHALSASLRSRLYLHGGPAHRQAAEETAEHLDRLVQQHPRWLPVVPAQLSIHRALVALQLGDPRAMASTLANSRARCSAISERELRWHSKRFHALSRVNAGAWTEGVAELEPLHRAAEQRAILGTSPFIAFDRVVVVSELTEAPLYDEATRRALQYEPSEPPSLWAMKLRALVTAGLLDEARAGLRALSPRDLESLPCDSNYLGTLGHVARAALLVGELDYVETLYRLLAPYPEQFCGQVSFLCEGSVSQLLGMLAHGLERFAVAASHFETAIINNERAGFAPRAAEARLQLTLSLLDGELANHRSRAQALVREVVASVERLGLRRLLAAATALTLRLQRY